MSDTREDTTLIAASRSRTRNIGCANESESRGPHGGPTRSGAVPLLPTSAGAVGKGGHLADGSCRQGGGIPEPGAPTSQIHRNELKLGAVGPQPNLGGLDTSC